MSSSSPPPISTNDIAPDAPADNQSASGVLDLGNEFVRLSTLLRQHAEEVSALARRARSAEDRCVEQTQNLEERAREIVALRDQLDEVNTRVAEFQTAGSRHLTEMQNLTADYAQRVATSEQESETLRARITELQGQITAQDERNALLEQRIADAVALDSRVAEAVQGISLILDDLGARGDAERRTIERVPVFAPQSGSTIAAIHPATQDQDTLVPPPAPARGWYGLGRKVK